jgi:hypothetical protein
MASGGTSNRVFARISALFFATRAALVICLVRIHAGNAKDVDARRLDDVDSVDAEAGTGTGRRRCLVHRDVGDDDGSYDAAVPGAGVWRYGQSVGKTGGSSAGRLTHWSP